MSLKERLGFTKEPIFLVDGSSFLYRGFYAFRDLARSDGFPTNAIYIVLRIMLKVLREESPRYLAFFLDGKGKTFRHEAFPDYKAHRPATPEDLVRQIEPLKDGLRRLGIHVSVSEGGEADDCIASLAARYKSERPVVILASDKDLNQCLDNNVYIWDLGGKTEKFTDLASFMEETGFRPEFFPDYQALIGDSSDNIPGVPGIGPKTALRIMADHPDLESILAHKQDLPGPVQKKLAGYEQAVYTYRDVTRLRLDFCADTSLPDFRVSPPDWNEVLAFLDEYEFRTLAREIRASGGSATPSGKAAPASRKAQSEQGSLFGAPAPTAPAPETRAAPTVSELPALAGAEVGLVWRENGFSLGIGDEEWSCRASATELAEALRKAARIHTPSVKELFTAEPDFADLPLDCFTDLSLAAYLLNPEDRSYDWRRLRDAMQRDPETEHLDPSAEGLCALALGRILEQRLRAAGLAELMRELEMPLIPVLVAMERAGVAIDRDAFAGFLAEVGARIAELEAEIHTLAGREFNVRSSQQLADVLFSDLGLKPRGKTPGGAPSTANAVLEKLRDEHDIIRAVLEFRMLEKLRSTYLEPLPKLTGKDGRIHTTFNQLATATGRLSSSSPNLQNIPIRGPHGARMRACFTAGPDSLLAAADYSQIELRVLAHFSGDPSLRDAFVHGEDIHARTAGLLFDKSTDAVTTEERRSAKTINFGLLYGMGPLKLSQELGASMKEAKEFIARYFERLTVLKTFYDRVLEEAETNGFVTTLSGRRRLLPEIHSRNANLAAQARRQAVNTLIQGSAADIIKMAMIAAHKDDALRGLGARLVLQVHDELLVETPVAAAAEAGARLQEIMRSVVRLKVPLMVDMGVGRTWAEAH